jgi:hypothetical protein
MFAGNTTVYSFTAALPLRHGISRTYFLIFRLRRYYEQTNDVAAVEREEWA